MGKIGAKMMLRRRLEKWSRSRHGHGRDKVVRVIQIVLMQYWNDGWRGIDAWRVNPRLYTLTRSRDF